MLNTITIKANQDKSYGKSKNQFILCLYGKTTMLSETVFICTVHGFENSYQGGW